MHEHVKTITCWGDPPEHVRKIQTCARMDQTFGIWIATKMDPLIGLVNASEDDPGVV